MRIHYIVMWEEAENKWSSELLKNTAEKETASPGKDGQVLVTKQMIALVNQHTLAEGICASPYFEIFGLQK